MFCRSVAIIEDDMANIIASNGNAVTRTNPANNLRTEITGNKSIGVPARAAHARAVATAFFPS